VATELGLKYYEVSAKTGKKVQELFEESLDVTINGKEVGYRSFKQYYRQYLSRKIEPAPREQLCLTAAEEMKQHMSFKKPEFNKLSLNQNHR
jgi:hypothetical protein